MLGLGSNLTKVNKLVLSPTTDNLVLKHDYQLRPVQPLSNGAASFDGTSDYVAIPTPSAFSGETLNSFDVTMSAWANFQTIGEYEAILCLGTYDLEIAPTSATEVGIWVDNAAYGGAVYTPTLNVWNHYAATKSGNTYTLYVNGVEIGSNDDADNASIGSSSFIGRNGSTNYFDGYICNAGIWSAALSQTEIKSIMWKNYAGLTSSEKPDLVSWWNLDTAYDSSVFDNHHSAGNTLGSELVGSAFYTAGVWTPDGTNTETVTTTTVKFERGNGSQGGYIYLRDNSDELTTDLTVGTTYKITLTFETDDSDAYVTIKDSSNNYHNFSAESGDKTLYYTATHATNERLMFQGISADKYVQISNVSVKEVNGNTGTLS